MITQATRDYLRFTCGDCHILARALHLRTGWPIGVTVDDFGEWFGHAFVVRPDGLALDVDGLSDPDDIADLYDTRDWTLTDWPTLRSKWGGADRGSHSYVRARIVADELLARYPHNSACVRVQSGDRKQADPAGDVRRQPGPSTSGAFPPLMPLQHLTCARPLSSCRRDA